jgi:hypothetical protein
MLANAIPKTSKVAITAMFKRPVIKLKAIHFGYQ